jgi:hypothetical protein
MTTGYACQQIVVRKINKIKQVDILELSILSGKPEMQMELFTNFKNAKIG